MILTDISSIHSKFQQLVAKRSVEHTRVILALQLSHAAVQDDFPLLHYLLLIQHILLQAAQDKWPQDIVKFGDNLVGFFFIKDILDLKQSAIVTNKQSGEQLMKSSGKFKVLQVRDHLRHSFYLCYALSLYGDDRECCLA